MNRFCLTISFNDQAKALEVFQKLKAKRKEDAGPNGLFLGKIKLGLTSRVNFQSGSYDDLAKLEIKFFADDFDDLNLATSDIKKFFEDNDIAINFDEFREYSGDDEGPGRYDAVSCHFVNS